MRRVTVLEIEWHDGFWSTGAHLLSQVRSIDGVVQVAVLDLGDAIDAGSPELPDGRVEARGERVPEGLYYGEFTDGASSVSNLNTKDSSWEAFNFSGGIVYEGRGKTMQEAWRNAQEAEALAAATPEPEEGESDD